jgi:hypothetical protein
MIKQPEYIEGRQATKNFEEGMKALFKVSKNPSAKKNAKQPTRATSRKSKRSDGN